MDQILHCKVRSLDSYVSLVLSFVYGWNSKAHRLKLWQEISSFGASLDEPWLLMGDFNAFSYEDEKTGYTGKDVSPCLDFLDCMNINGLADLRDTGCFFTWYNHQGEGSWIKAKLDRAVGNNAFMERFDRAEAFFPNVDISYHSPVVV
ncbi:hypothetical protein Droror1_Dr00027185 [Drosera rotundifolia]